MRVDAILQRKPKRIVSVTMGTTVEAAARLLKSENIGAVVVKDSCGTEGEVVLGILSERDIVRALADRGGAVLSAPVGSLMTRSIISCRPDDDAQRVIELMQEHQIRHVPVLDREALIGVVSIRDVLGTPAGNTLSMPSNKTVTEPLRH
jgi:CBS domain-containing protein